MLGSAYFKNLVGFKLTDAEMETIPQPRLELITHVTIKDIQAFGLLGTFLIGPLVAVARKPSRNAAGVTRLATRCGKFGALLGVVAGPAMSIAKMKSLDEDAIRDRCYRLRMNRNQVRVDQASIVGVATGATLGVVTGQGPVFLALLGMNGGVIAAAIYNAVHGDKKT